MRVTGSRRGFTLIEVVIVLAIGGVLSGLAIYSFGAMRGSMSVNSARGTFLTMLSATRATAVERGTLMRLVADPDAGTISIEEGCDGGDVVRSQSVDVTIEVDGDVFAVCMTPRGYADPSSNSFDDEGTISFSEGGEVVQVTVLSLGQVIQP